MKDGLKYIVGKTIAGVVVASSKGSPHNQVFLIFPDGSRFELYGDNFSCCAGLDSAARIPHYVASGKGEIVNVYDEALDPDDGMRFDRGREEIGTRAPETLASRMKRDLDAWNAAKDVIQRICRRSRHDM